MRVLGIDVGADRIHVVALDRDEPTGPDDSLGWAVGDAWVFAPNDPAIEEMLAGTPPTSVGIDGPDGPSTAPFRDDPTLAAKWRGARGCEVELGRQFGIWVSFATPTAPLAGWMGVATALFDATRRHRHTPLETYPHAVYRRLAGRRLAKKTTAEGIDARVAALVGAHVTGPHLALWSHDALDAAAAALVAAHHATGRAVGAHCRRDNTTIWLPAEIDVAANA